jgi:hypothetical protein
MTSLINNQHCYAKGSYGRRTTSRCPYSYFHCPSVFVSYNGFPQDFHIFSALCYTGWGCLFPASIVRGSQTQTAAYFFYAFPRF